jgi:hypothetical protein
MRIDAMVLAGCSYALSVRLVAAQARGRRIRDALVRRRSGGRWRVVHA